MSGRTKPSRRRTMPRPIALDPITLAVSRATLYTPAERAAMLAPCRAGLHAMRTGNATEADWIHLVTAAAIALSVEHHGIVRGLSRQLITADHTLATIGKRAMATAGHWQAPTLYGEEINTIAELVRLYTFQLSQVSCGEFRQALAHAEANMNSQHGHGMTSVAADEVSV